MISAKVHDGWYISGNHANRAIGYLSGIFSDKGIDLPDLAAAWGKALEVTLDDTEASPIHSSIIEKGLVTHNEY